MNKEIIIKTAETEITIDEQAISVSTPDIFVMLMDDGNSMSMVTVTKHGIVSQVQ